MFSKLPKLIIFSILAFSLIFSPLSVSAFQFKIFYTPQVSQKTRTYTTAGLKTWTAPADVTAVMVELWGGGSNGDGAYQGYGGHGGAYAKKNSYTVTPGSNYTVYVGAAGQDSYFVNTATVKAQGGNNGGLDSGSVGDTKYSGGVGGQNMAGGGGGGGGAGSGGAGGFGQDGGNSYTCSDSGGSGGLAGIGANPGGDGGWGADDGGIAEAGHQPGGGGGGGSDAGCSTATAASGAPGQAILTYTSAYTTEVLTTPGSNTWTAPTGVTSVQVELWGAGGGGGSGDVSAGAGAGGGAYSKGTVTVTPGTGYTVLVGNGGGSDTNGEDSSFNTSSVVAKGGIAGGSDGGDGGAGGQSSSGTGNVKYSGGSGINGSGANGGGGGGAAGINADGGNGSGSSGGTAGSDGGAGGNGGGSGQDGYNASVPGGGGGGGGRDGGGGGGAGGNGGTGQAILTYTAQAAPVFKFFPGVKLFK